MSIYYYYYLFISITGELTSICMYGAMLSAGLFFFLLRFSFYVPPNLHLASSEQWSDVGLEEGEY